MLRRLVPKPAGRRTAGCLLPLLLSAVALCQNRAAPPTAADLVKRHHDFMGLEAQAKTSCLCDGVLEMGSQRYRFEESWDGPKGQELILRVTAPNGRTLSVTRRKGELVAQEHWKGGPALPKGGSPLDVARGAAASQLDVQVNLIGIEFDWASEVETLPGAGAEPSPLGDGVWRVRSPGKAPFLQASYDFNSEGALLATSVFLAVRTDGQPAGQNPSDKLLGAYVEAAYEFGDYCKVGEFRIPFLASVRVNGVFRSLRRYNVCRAGESLSLPQTGGAQ